MTTIKDIQAQVLDLKNAHDFGETTLEQHLAFLVSEVGEVAREVLRLGRTSDVATVSALKERLGMELYDVIWNACAIAELAGIDLEACIVRKVEINRARRWAGSEGRVSNAAH